MNHLKQPATNEDLPVDHSLDHSNEEEGKVESHQLRESKDYEVHEIEEDLR